MAKISQAGGPSYGAEEAVVEEPAVEETTEPEAEAVEETEPDEPEGLLAEVVPEGTVDEVIGWTEDDSDPPARLLAARDAEAAKPTPRSTLMSELERRLAQF